MAGTQPLGIFATLLSGHTTANGFQWRNTNFDSGVDGHTTEPIFTFLGDLNSDGTVNALDWSIMNAAWFTNNATADINTDGIVSSIDFGLMNRNWGLSS